MTKSGMVGACLILALTIVGGFALGGVEGSKHDFSNKAWSTDDMCGACHSPHRAQPPKAAPLWDPDADLTRTFGTSIGTTAMPGIGTLMCLRCHDGTIATETITAVKASRRLQPARITARARTRGLSSTFGTGHGRSDHPVGVDYPQFDKGYRPITSVLASSTVMLPNSRVECISCHDPHNQSGEEHMLVTSNARSALCLTCHKK